MFGWVDVQDKYDESLLNDANILYFPLKNNFYPVIDSPNLSQWIKKNKLGENDEGA